MEHFVKFINLWLLRRVWSVSHSVSSYLVTVWTLIWWHLLLCGPPQVEDFLRIAQA
jgi:hypothetical protein